eukprot:UN05040
MFTNLREVNCKSMYPLSLHHTTLEGPPTNLVFFVLTFFGGNLLKRKELGLVTKRGQKT